MPYRPTGRQPGRPRGPLTPEGRVRKARTTLPHVRAFPALRKAVDRAVFDPRSVIVRVQKSSHREVMIEHRFTPIERYQALSFVEWVYSNRNVWPARKLTSSVTAISPLMLFSSAFFAQMTGLPQSTVSKHMVRSPDLPVSKVTGTCSMDVIHALLEETQEGMDSYRNFVAKLTVTKRVPKAMLSRVSGVPVSVLTQPERGVQFFPEEPDYLFREVTSVSVLRKYWERKRSRPFDPDPGHQSDIRSAFQGRFIDDFTWISAPIVSDTSPEPSTVSKRVEVETETELENRENTLSPVA